MEYDDQHYSEINPETLDQQRSDEVILAVWAALRPCRDMTAEGQNRDANHWIRWAKPKKWNPDCGFEVSVPGKFFGKKVFASIALNIVGDDFDIYVQRRHRDLVLVFSTRDDGPLLSPSGRLKAAIGKMMALTEQFDQWSRDGVLVANFPSEWCGTRGTELLKAYVAGKILSSDWQGGRWRDLVATLINELLIDDEFSIERRSRKLRADRSWGRTFATFAPLSVSWLLVTIGYFFAGWQLIMLDAVMSVFDYRSVLLAPISILFFVGATVVAVRHTVALWRYFNSLAAKGVLMLAITWVIALISEMWWGIHQASQ